MSSIQKAESKVKQAEDEAEDALALQPAEDALEILVELAEDSPAWRAAADRLDKVWQQRHLTEESVAREKRVVKLVADFRRRLEKK